jgi:hypothetical protein
MKAGKFSIVDQKGMILFTGDNAKKLNKILPNLCIDGTARLVYTRLSNSRKV